MTRRKRVARIIVAAILGIAAGMFVSVNYLPKLSTYGVSVGTNTAYCSVDLVGSSLQAACQSGR